MKTHQLKNRPISRIWKCRVCCENDGDDPCIISVGGKKPRFCCQRYGDALNKHQAYWKQENNTVLVNKTDFNTLINAVKTLDKKAIHNQLSTITLDVIKAYKKIL